MSIDALSWAFRQPLQPGPKLVLLALADRCDEWARCYPSVSDIMRRTGMSERSIRRHITALVDAQCVTVETRSRPAGGQASNRYRLHVDGAPPAAHHEDDQEQAAEPGEEEVRPLGRSNAHSAGSLPNRPATVSPPPLPLWQPPPLPRWHP